MTNTQLQRLTKASLAARIEDLEATVDTLNQTLAQPVEPSEAVTSLLVRARNDGAGIILLLIEAGQTTFALGRKARQLLDEALVGAGWGSGWRS